MVAAALPREPLYQPVAGLLAQMRTPDISAEQARSLMDQARDSAGGKLEAHLTSVTANVDGIIAMGASAGEDLFDEAIEALLAMERGGAADADELLKEARQTRVVLATQGREQTAAMDQGIRAIKAMIHRAQTTCRDLRWRLMAEQAKLFPAIATGEAQGTPTDLDEHLTSRR